MRDLFYIVSLRVFLTQEMSSTSSCVREPLHDTEMDLTAHLNEPYEGPITFTPYVKGILRHTSTRLAFQVQVGFAVSSMHSGSETGQ